MKVRGVADAELERSVQVVRETCRPGDGAHAREPARCRRPCRRRPTTRRLRAAPTSSSASRGVQHASSAITGTDDAAGLGEFCGPRSGCSTRSAPASASAHERTPCPSSSAVAAVGVERRSTSSPSSAQASDEPSVALDVASTLDLERADAVSDSGLALVDASSLGIRPSMCATGTSSRASASEERVTPERHTHGRRGRAARCRGAPSRRGSPRRARRGGPRARPSENGRSSNAGARYSWTIAVIVAGVSPCRRPSASPQSRSPTTSPQPSNAVGLDPDEHELAKRPGEGEPAKVGAGRKADDERLDAVDRDQHQALLLDGHQEVPCSSTAATRMGEPGSSSPPGGRPPDRRSLRRLRATRS